MKGSHPLDRATSNAWTLTKRLGAMLPLSLLVVLHTLASETPFQNDRFELDQSWAQYSPYFPVAKYPKPPSACLITQVCAKLSFQGFSLTQLYLG